MLVCYFGLRQCHCATERAYPKPSKLAIDSLEFPGFTMKLVSFTDYCSSN